LPLFTAAHALALALQALRQPRRQGLAVERLDADAGAGRIERAEPRRLLLLVVQPWQRHQRQHVFRQALAVALQRIGTLLAGLARGDADLDQPPLGEQAHGLRRAEHAAPVEVRAADGEDLALAVAGGARRGADGVTGFLRQQRLVAVDGVERLQAARELAFELFRAQLHRAAFRP